jgi:hypothetical protein
MPKIKNADDVAFLTFEGGGGKGVTYVGAIRALEELGILPIPFVTQGPRDDTRYESILIGPDPKFVLDGDHLQKQNAKIKGVSGASAGAITALLITLGHSALSLWSLLKRRHDFEALYDAPFPGLLRGVVANQPVRVFNRNLGVKDEAGREQAVRRRVQSEIPVLYGIIPFKQLIRRAKDKVAFIKKLQRVRVSWLDICIRFFTTGDCFPGLSSGAT